MSCQDNIDDIKYCRDFICTYHLHDLDDQDDMYKCQMVQAFMIEDWYDDSVNKTVRKLFGEFTNEKNPQYLENKFQIEKLFEKIECHLFPNNCLEDCKIKTKLDKQLILFQYLFGFDYFFKTHELICNFFNGKNNKKLVSEKIVDELINLCASSNDTAK